MTSNEWQAVCHTSQFTTIYTLGTLALDSGRGSSGRKDTRSNGSNRGTLPYPARVTRCVKLSPPRPYAGQGSSISHPVLTTQAGRRGGWLACSEFGQEGTTKVSPITLRWK